MRECPDMSELHRYHAGELGGDDYARLDAHLKCCVHCAQRNARLVAAHENLLDELRQMPFGESSDDPRDLTATLTQPPQADGDPIHRPIPIHGYRILDVLSHGGQGVVYRAVQESTNREVAVKVLLQGSHASATARKRFQREIELAARLAHPNIVTVFHSGTTDEGLQYCVMGYVHGLPLQRYVRSRALGLDNTLRLFVTVCEAVEYAHAHGIVHRDLKPSNILVNTEGQPQVLDFGLAKATEGPVGTAVSMSRDVIGTLPYMAPEQAKGAHADIDARTDVYALGITLYELLTGRFPYPVDGEIGQALKHIVETPPVPPQRQWKSESGVKSRSFRGSRSGRCPIDRDVQTIILKALFKEPERRYESAGAFGADVVRYLQHEPILARPPSVGYRLRKFVRKRWLPAAATLIIAITIGLTAYYQIRARRASQAMVMETAQRLFSEAQLDSYRKPAAAIGKFEDAIALVPDYIDAKVQRAFLLKRENRVEEAIKAAEEILLADPSAGAVHLLLSQLYLTRDPELAALHREKGRRLLPNDKYYLALSLDDSEAEEAIKLLSEYLYEDGGHFDARWARAWRYFAQGDFERMLADAEFLTTLRAKSATAWNIRGLALGRLGRLKEAVAAYDKSIKLSPDYAPTYLNRAETLAALQRMDKGIVDCNTAIRLEGDFAAAYALRGRLKYYQEDNRGALADCRRAIQLDPANAMAFHYAGRAQFELKRFDDALDALDRAVQLDPQSAEALCARGDARFRQKSYKAASEDYSAAIDLRPTYATAIHRRGLCLEELGRIDEAIGCFSRAIELDDASVSAFYDRARLYRIQGRHDLALADLEEALTRKPKLAKLRRERAIEHWLADRRSKAIEELGHYLAMDDEKRPLEWLLLWLFRSVHAESAATRSPADALAAAAANAKEPWHRLIVRMCRHEAGEAELLAAATTDGQRCEAFYYLGARSLVDKKPAEAESYFRQCLDTQMIKYCEYQLAKHFLARDQEPFD